MKKGSYATVELIALVSGRSERQVRQALTSLENQGVVSMVGNHVTELYGFPGERA